MLQMFNFLLQFQTSNLSRLEIGALEPEFVWPSRNISTSIALAVVDFADFMIASTFEKSVSSEIARADKDGSAFCGVKFDSESS